MVSIKGKNALVTGASSGIGYEIAKYLAKLGANLVIVARRKERLEKLKKEIVKEYKVQVNIIVMDLSLRESSETLFKKIKKLKINIDILINNAERGMHTYFASSSWEKNQTMLDLMIVNLIHLTHLFVQGMIERKSGYILNISSIGAFQPSPTYAIYSAIKSLIYNFSIACNYELKNKNIKCTAICPGTTKTEFFETAKHGDKTFYSKYFQMTAVKVAKIGIRAMLKGKNYIIPGLFNKINSFLARHLPRSIITKIAASAMGEPKAD